MSGKTILVVDDEPFILRALTFVLNREGYRTVTAANGEEALLRMRELRPDLVFLDVMMPKKNGFEVCQEAKRDPDLSRIFIILLTAKGQESDRVKGLAAGADEYMTKPFSPSEVLARVREIVGWPQAGMAKE
jgi:two-component system phosphate regulon response regulator PhoB